jgi:hypothetical protein
LTNAIATTGGNWLPHGGSWGDFDNDGRQDIFYCARNEESNANSLFHNITTTAADFVQVTMGRAAPISPGDLPVALGGLRSGWFFGFVRGQFGQPKRTLAQQGGRHA